jgi:ribosome-binding protein aMBF1 (putative translation factor)
MSNKTDLEVISDPAKRLVNGETFDGRPRAKTTAVPTPSASPTGSTRRALFAAKVRSGRAVLGWSQTQLGKRLGISQRAVYKIEHSAVTARKSTEDAISQLFESLGLRFEMLPDGGLVIRVDGRLLGNDQTIPDRS